MALKRIKFGIGYACTLENCRGRHGAHPSGLPLGTPADSKTRKARIDAHEVFDRLWKCRVMTRTEAYRWLREAMGLTANTGHISSLNTEQCKLLEEKMREEFPDLFLSLDPA